MIKIRTHTQPTPISGNLFIALFLLSAATLAFEINLSRLFSVTQFYHFAFMIVSIALLGFGASGALLAIFPRIGEADLNDTLARLSLATSLTMLAAFLLINWLPFDSFSVAWDSRQIWILIGHYISLSIPFFLSGLAVGVLLSNSLNQAGFTYGVNLLGSAVGCILALLAPSFWGGEGTVILSSGLAALAAIFAIPLRSSRHPQRFSPARYWIIIPVIFLLVFDIWSLGLMFYTGRLIPWFELRISPYKSLSYALQYPDAERIFSEWNAFSRVDLVRSAGIRSLPGLSYRYTQPPPAEDGLLVDGDELTPVILPGYQPDIFHYTPSAIVYQLRPQAEALVLEPRGGLEILIAEALGASRITAVESNPLNLRAAEHIYNTPVVEVVQDSGRSALHKFQDEFDLVVLPLSDSFHPVRSGAYSLAEDYRYTVEAFRDALNSLKPDGLLIATRWLQTPPSETLRLFAIAVTALDQQGASANQQVIAFRSFNTGTVVVKKGAFTQAELQSVRQFCDQLAYDLVYLPDLAPSEVNRYNIMPTSVYYQAFTQLLNSSPRETYYLNYPYDVHPPSDDQPFFGHFFKWSQSKQVLSELGKTWQPFGGAGYFVIIALLVLACFLALVIILLPAALYQLRISKVKRIQHSMEGASVRIKAPVITISLYFALIGFAFLLVEIPLIQAFIRYLGQPAYAMTIVLFSILLFSGIGSLLSDRMPLIAILGVLVLILLGMSSFLGALFELAPGSSLITRILFALLFLAPIGLLMGFAFPGGLRWARTITPQPAVLPVAQIWAVNGASSVVASVLAALLSISFGFRFVLQSGALCYLGACLVLVLSILKKRGKSRQ